jgi:hypothetical protein
MVGLLCTEQRFFRAAEPLQSQRPAHRPSFNEALNLRSRGQRCQEFQMHRVQESLLEKLSNRVARLRARISIIRQQCVGAAEREAGSPWFAGTPKASWAPRRQLRS